MILRFFSETIRVNNVNKDKQRQYTLHGHAPLYFKYALKGLTENRHFKNAASFCLFLGPPRSGQSLLASLLDAHPQAVVAHEADVLFLVELGWRRKQIDSYIMDNAKRFGAGRGWSGYDYEVQAQWQGKASDIKVIGDKKNGGINRRLRANPGLLDALHRRIPRRIVWIHHLRNPFDNIAAMYRHHRIKYERGSTKNNKSLMDAIRSYFRMIETSEWVRSKSGAEWFQGYHEDLIEDPKNYLRQLCLKLGLETSEEYLKACGSLVWRQPNEARSEISWSSEELKCVEEYMRRYDFFDKYKGKMK